MNELITSHQSGWNSSKAVMSQYLAQLRLGIAGAVIYLGHGETPANTDVFVAGKQNKERRSSEFGWMGVARSGAVIPLN